MSNPTVSFRISNYHLARALRAIRILEPSWQLTTPSDLIRTIFNDYIAKSEHLHNTPLEVSPDLLQEIDLARSNTRQTKYFELMPQLGQTNQPRQTNQKSANQKSAQQIQQEAEQDRLFNEMKRESLEAQAKEESQQNQAIDEQIESEIESTFQPTKPRIKPSEFDDPNITESTISSVTDFSPPTDWKE